MLNVICIRETKLVWKIKKMPKDLRAVFRVDGLRLIDMSIFTYLTWLSEISKITCV